MFGRKNQKKEIVSEVNTEQRKMVILTNSIVDIAEGYKKYAGELDQNSMLRRIAWLRFAVAYELLASVIPFLNIGDSVFENFQSEIDIVKSSIDNLKVVIEEFDELMEIYNTLSGLTTNNKQPDFRLDKVKEFIQNLPQPTPSKTPVVTANVPVTPIMVKTTNTTEKGKTGKDSNGNYWYDGKMVDKRQWADFAKRKLVNYSDVC